MLDPIPWADGPPPVPVASVWTPPAGTWDLVVLGPWFSVWLHWLGKRSLPCLAEYCPAARHIKPVRWSAYCPAALAEWETAERKKVKSWRPVVLPIGLECAHELRPQLGEFPGPGIILTRKGGQKAWTWKIGSLQRIPANLPKPFDVRPTLYRLWGVRPPDQAAQPDQAND
jgi:hypothetical protein